MTTIERLEKELVGLPKLDSEKIVFILGFAYRVTVEDGVAYIVTQDFRTDRINVKLENGIVVEAYIG
jgi:hypothetical protein